MRLGIWMQQRQLDCEDMARLVEARSGRVVRRWLDGTIPRPKFIQRIVKVTRGKVTANDFFVTPRPSRPPPTANMRWRAAAARRARARGAVLDNNKKKNEEEEEEEAAAAALAITQP